MHTRLFAPVGLLAIGVVLALALFSGTAQAQCSTDADGDGYVDAACGGTDCDDTNPLINPGALEIPGDGIDSDCNSQELCYQDGDADGYFSVNPENSTDFTCAGPLLSPTTNGDCDDGDASINPGAVDIPENGIDEDCDGMDATPVATSDDRWGMLKGRY
jgi:Putative metal-binding motif